MIATRKVSVQAENLPQVTAQIFDVVADTSNTELTEVRQVLANLRGVELVAFGQRLRGDRLHAARIQLVEAPEIHRQAVCREFRDLIGRLPALVQPIHKVQCYHLAPWHTATMNRPESREQARSIRTCQRLGRRRSSRSEP